MPGLPREAMIAVLAALLLQADDSCYVEFLALEVRNAELQQALTAEGILVNRSPKEIGDVSVEVSLHADNGARIRAMPRVTFTRLAPRKGVTLAVKDVPIPQATAFAWRAKVTYRLEGIEKTFEFEGLKPRFGKLYEDPEAGTRLGLAGLRVVAGSYQTVNKKSVYTGDTLFLRLRVEALDDKARPQGQIETTLALDGKRQGSIKRSIEAGHWKLDAKNLPSNDADPKIICYDPVARELLIGLCRVDDERRSAKLGLEVKFTWKKQTWTWSSLEPPFVEAPRPAEKQ